MTNEELRATVAKAVSRGSGFASLHIVDGVTDAVVAALAPLVVTREPEPEPVRSVPLADGRVVTYQADATKRWHWASSDGTSGDLYKLAYLTADDDELAACLALREPLEDAVDVWKVCIMPVLDAVAAGWNSGSGTTLDRAENVIRELGGESEGWRDRARRAEGRASDAEARVKYLEDRGLTAEKRAHAAEARLQRARAVLVGEP